MPFPRVLGHDRRAVLVTQDERHGGVHVFIAEKLGEPLDSAFRRPATSVVVVALDFQAGEAHGFSERQQGFIHTHTHYSELTRNQREKKWPVPALAASCDSSECSSSVPHVGRNRRRCLCRLVACQGAQPLGTARRYEACTGMRVRRELDLRTLVWTGAASSR